MISAVLAGAVALVPGQQIDVALQVGSAPEALSACQAQHAAANGMSAEVFVGADGSFLVHCRLSPPTELGLVALDQGPPRVFMVCRSRYKVEADKHPFCRMLRADETR